MGNTSCLCEKTQMQCPNSLRNSRILDESPRDQMITNEGNSSSNNNSNNTPGNVTKQQLIKNRNLAKICQQYGTRNCIEEENISSCCDSVYSEMVNNSIYHLSSLISNGPHSNYRNENNNIDTKNSLAFLTSPNSNSVSQAGASGKVSNSSSQKNFKKEGGSKKQKHYQISLDVLIAGIALSNPEGDRIKQGQKIILRHINSEMNLHSHYRKHETGSKLQEVSVCSSRLLHEHDFWIIDTPQNYYDNLNQSNRVWAQIGKLKASDDTAASQSNECILGDDSDSYYNSTSKLAKLEQESSILKSPYILSTEDIILKHCATQRELASCTQFIDTSSKTQQVFCDELSHNFQIKELFNWKIIVHNSDGFLRDNSIIQIVHSETNKPLCINKQCGILQNTQKVACASREYSMDNRQMNDFWIINRVQTDSSFLMQLPEEESNNGNSTSNNNNNI